MLTNNNKIVLIYGFDKEEIQTLEDLIIQESLPSYKIITKEMASMKIKDIVQGFKFEIYESELPDEKLVLFNNIEDNELNDIINIFRQRFSENVILAVVTSTSEEWIFKELLEHLIEERNWHKTYNK